MFTGELHWGGSETPQPTMLKQFPQLAPPISKIQMETRFPISQISNLPGFYIIFLLRMRGGGGGTWLADPNLVKLKKLLLKYPRTVDDRQMMEQYNSFERTHCRLSNSGLAGSWGSNGRGQTADGVKLGTFFKPTLRAKIDPQIPQKG